VAPGLIDTPLHDRMPAEARKAMYEKTQTGLPARRKGRSDIMTTCNMHYADATELAALIRSRQLSPVEVVRAHIDRIETLNPKLNAIVTLVADRALEAAKTAETAVMNADKLGPLHGVPFTTKDALDTAGVLTQRGSPIFKGRIPDTDATSVARFKAAGAILIAKTNLPEFSYATETDNLLTGRANNPWNLDSGGHVADRDWKRCRDLGTRAGRPHRDCRA
jgi:Asp-tRNA(Asn)/Glu-tRNA(Gln) amidotransferase A subunit family amidase